jgi:glycosyltransferase involved in cell wall biosynthesis
MKEKIKDRKIVVVNQAVNYLTVGICNAFADKFEWVSLITGNVHEQGESLSDDIGVTRINKYIGSPGWKKFLSYMSASFRICFLLMTRFRNHEVFFVSVPPMAYLLKVILPHRTSILVWDVYPDLFKITGMKESHPVYRVWAALNRRVFKKTYRLFTIGERMSGLLEKYVQRDKILVTPIWSVFQTNGKLDKHENPFVKQHSLKDKFVVQYSGNIGLTHNVEVLIEIAAMLKDKEDILFQIIGKGTRLPALKQRVEEKNLKNCQFLPFQPDEMFPLSLSAADLGVVILDDETSKGSVPSKSYNLMSFGIPSLYIAADDSELNDYADKYNHAVCFHKEELEEISLFISQLKNDPERHNEYSRNALQAAREYRRTNADKIVELYIK